MFSSSEIETIRSTARSAPGCHQGCGVILHVQNGKLIKVTGDRDFPFNQGVLCPRCRALPEVVYHPDRLKYPLKRIGKKGGGKWERISWEEAFETISSNFNNFKFLYGAESVLFCTGTQRDIAGYLNRLADSFGSPHSLSFGPLLGHACFVPRIAASMITMGDLPVADCSQYFKERWNNPQWHRPETIIIWGKNPGESNSDGFLGSWITKCVRLGTELIVIDPRKIPIASKAGIWLQIRPGTDGALALGMLNVIINRKLYNSEFVDKWTHGFEELKTAVQDYNPAAASRITWVPEELIIASAEKYAKAEPASIFWGVAVDQTKESIPAIHAMLCLMAITGNIDIPGGNVFRCRNFNIDPIFNWGDVDLPEEQRKKAIGIEGYPLLEAIKLYKGDDVLEQMLSGHPYPIKAAWIQGTNTFVCGSGDSARTYEAFKKIDFTVVTDIFMTPTAEAFADIVLPAATYAEKNGIAVTDGMSGISAINKAIEPAGECRADAEIILEMGKYLAPDHWKWNTTIEMFDYMLERAGISFSGLKDSGPLYDDFYYHRHDKGLNRADGSPGFSTPTGKIELYSTVFKAWGLDPLPYYEEPPESPLSTPELFQKYPFILTTGGKTKVFFHSEHRQIKSLRRMNPDPLLEIHPASAAALGIVEGDWVCIENSHGKCIQKAKITEDIDRRVVHAQHGWWFPEKDEKEPSLYGAWQSNINLLLPSGWTGKAGLGYPFKAQICRVYKTKAPD